MQARRWVSKGSPHPQAQPAPLQSHLTRPGCKAVFRHACERTVLARVWVCSSGVHGCREVSGALRMWSSLPQHLDTWRRQHAVPLLKSPDSAWRPLGKNIPPLHPGAGNRVTTCKEPVTHISLLLASNLILIRQEGPCPQGVGRQGLSSAGAAGRHSAGTRGGEGWSRREHSEENAQKNVRERSAESLCCTPETKAAP